MALDAGLSCREIVKRMRLSGEEPEGLDAVLVTHEHVDHIQGLSVFARRFDVPVYTTEATHAAWRRLMVPRKTMSFSAWLEQRRQDAREMIPEASSGFVAEIAGGPDAVAQGSVATEVSAMEATATGIEEFSTPEPARDDPAYLPAVEYFRAGTRFQVGDICVTPFTIPHDAADPVGFVLEAEGLRVVIATDLGYLSPNVRMHLKRADLLMIESNHDLEMLRDGPYPWSVKQRVLSRVGHLSNEALGEFLAKEYDGSARFVVLAHLSESNNMPELARISAERALENHMTLLDNKVLLASQPAPLESIQL